MTDLRRSSLGYSFPLSRSGLQAELAERVVTAVETGNSHHQDQVNRRRSNRHRIIENPLAHLNDEELDADVSAFQKSCLPKVDRARLLRAARVAQNVRSYDEIARSDDPEAGRDLPVQLDEEEKTALKAEKDSLFSQQKMLPVILTVSLAAFLQGFVQSSINGASLYAYLLGLINAVQTHSNSSAAADDLDAKSLGDQLKLGAMNASPFFFAALLGCWMSLPINDWIGRRGAMAVAAGLIFASSLGAPFCTNWVQLFSVRILNGIGMGLKAVSTPILASETAIGYWRGSFILAWQLWVAFGIMIGFAFNLIFYSTKNDWLAFQLILGAPFVPSIFLMVGLWFCPESPRYYMRKSARYNPQKAYDILRRLRKTELQALRDVYLVYKSVQLEEYPAELGLEPDNLPQGFVAHVKGYAVQYKQLFTRRRLRNALISSSIVSLAQQLCGINVFAFYSGTLFSGALGQRDQLKPMIYSLANGAVNFVFGLPAIRTIDTLGRRKWLVLTLPFMCLFMLAASLSTFIENPETRAGIIALFVFLFTAAYSPGMGPIPFTLASESFPLSHREAGCAFAIATNLLFAGLIQMFFPSINAGLRDGGSLGLFAGLDLVALALVFLLVEETKRRSLEDLDLVFAVRKRDFIRHQALRYLPWFLRTHVLRRPGPDKPELYVDLIWQKERARTQGYGGDEEEGGVRRQDWYAYTMGGAGGGGGGGGEDAKEERGHDGASIVSPTFARRPSGFPMVEPVARISEDSNDSAHK
ncbi:hypothetical protein GGR52DRAFT_571961 [Hypoxylon sp. FL1284]|nr:hypothetical protein GGR52DRAFT_571961 [Hypoxylon sp. FL1284]